MRNTALSVIMLTAMFWALVDGMEDFEDDEN